MTIGVVTGMVAEADCLGAAAIDATVQVTGADVDRARAAAAALCEAGVDALVSFGLAGGLDPRLEPGDLVIADSVIGTDGARHDADTRWRLHLAAAAKATAPFVVGPIAGSDTAIMTPAAKAALHDRYGAVAVDMESHIVAAAAAESGLPFLVVRAVADPAGRAIPATALAGLGTDGRARPLAVLRALLARPGDVSALLALARDSRHAMRSLRRIAPALA
jgi:hopanoid-associated phosphorylase